MLLIGIGRGLVYYDADLNVQTAPFKKIFDAEFSEKRFCIGFYDGKKWNYCGSLTPGIRCERCKEKDLLTICARGDRKCPRYDEEHVLYLAYFGGSLLKVGITRTWRVRERLWEQGALGYVILDEGVGWRLLKVEREISSMFAIPTSVSKEKKILAYKKGISWKFLEEFGRPRKIEENVAALKYLQGQGFGWDPILSVGIRLGPFLLSEKKIYYLPDYKGRKFNFKTADI